MVKGLAFPTYSAYYVNWAPPLEKSRLIGLTVAGGPIGSFISLIFGGFLCNNGFYYGWGSIFIIFGGVGIVWLVLLVFLTYNKPSDHRFISKGERAFIEKSIADAQIKQVTLDQPIPWLGILTCKPAIGCIIMELCNSWGIYIFITELPTFLQQVLKFNITSV
jgi:MFS family permease